MKSSKKWAREAVEVIIAAKGETDDRVIYELADFVYHTLVLLNLRGLGVGRCRSRAGAALRLKPT
jgi:phosphoribosyl-ATP pyrophosphohydrolase